MAEAVRHEFRNRPEAGRKFSVPIEKGRPDESRLPLRYWNPGNFASANGEFRTPWWMSRRRYGRFRDRLRRIDRSLDVTYDYDEGKWAIWVRDHKVKWEHSPGWRLLFFATDLDERILDRLELVDSTRYGGSMHYFRWWEGRSETRRQRQERERRQEIRDAAAERWAYTLPKVSMAGHTSGRKFADHHSGG